MASLGCRLRFTIHGQLMHFSFILSAVLIMIFFGPGDTQKSPSGLSSVGCPTIVSRADWGAKPPKKRHDMVTPVPYVIIHHTAMDECYDFDECTAEMRKIQQYHQDTRGWWDIGYNFCVGQDGRVYEGRGWDTVGAQAPGYNNRSIGICIMGNYMTKLPNQASIHAVKSLINCTVENDKLEKSYILYGHRQVRATDCPGDDLYEELQSWPQWKPGKHFPPGKDAHLSDTLALEPEDKQI